MHKYIRHLPSTGILQIKCLFVYCKTYQFSLQNVVKVQPNIFTLHILGLILIDFVENARIKTSQVGPDCHCWRHPGTSGIDWSQVLVMEQQSHCRISSSRCESSGTHGTTHKGVWQERNYSGNSPRKKTRYRVYFSVMDYTMTVTFEVVYKLIHSLILKGMLTITLRPFVPPCCSECGRQASHFL